jgi:hypothetical protein
MGMRVNRQNMAAGQSELGQKGVIAVHQGFDLYSRHGLLESGVLSLAKHGIIPFFF